MMTNDRVQAVLDAARVVADVGRHNDVCHARLSSRGSPYDGTCVCGMDALRKAVEQLRSAPEPKSPEAQAPESELLAAARGVLRFRAGDHADSWENFKGSDDAWDEMKEAAFNRLILAVEAQGAEKSEGGR